MKMTDADRSGLTNEEQALRGEPGDLLSESLVPRRARATSVLVSLRLDRATFDELSELAERRGKTFSLVAREAVRSYLAFSKSDHAYPQAGGQPARRRVSESRLRSWDDVSLRAALDDYEAACRGASMRENAWRSYVDYARRFLAWREGAYQPRGEPDRGRPAPQTPATTDVLRAQARDYADQVAAAGREQPTIDTYFRHAMFFIRWLEGDFQPGARLRGLR